MKRWRFLFPVVAALALVGSTLPAGATHVPDQSSKMSKLFTSPNGRTNSDLAFWGNHAFVGYYSGSDATPSAGVRIFDISNPAAPRLVKDVQCDGLQADPIVWDRNGNGVADLLMLAVDRTMANPECGAPRTAHDDPQGWEGVRVFEIERRPGEPVRDGGAGCVPSTPTAARTPSRCGPATRTRAGCSPTCRPIRCGRGRRAAPSRSPPRPPAVPEHREPVRRGSRTAE